MARRPYPRYLAHQRGVQRAPDMIGAREDLVQRREQFPRRVLNGSRGSIQPGILRLGIENRMGQKPPQRRGSADKPPRLPHLGWRRVVQAAHRRPRAAFGHARVPIAPLADGAAVRPCGLLFLTKQLHLNNPGLRSTWAWTPFRSGRASRLAEPSGTARRGNSFPASRNGGPASGNASSRSPPVRRHGTQAMPPRIRTARRRGYPSCPDSWRHSLAIRRRRRLRLTSCRMNRPTKPTPMRATASPWRCSTIRSIMSRFIAPSFAPRPAFSSH